MNMSRIVVWARTRLAAAGLLAAALFFASSVPAHAGPSFSLTPSATTVAQNQAFTVSVLANDVTDLFGYQFDVLFDPSLFRVDGVAEGSFLSGANSTFFSPGTIDNASGSVSFVFDTILGNVAGVSGSGLLATINLVALNTATGTGSVGLDGVIALNSGLDLIDLGPVTAAAVSVVPEPALWAMLPFGLFALSGRRRQRLSGALQA